MIAILIALGFIIYLTAAAFAFGYIASNHTNIVVRTFPVTAYRKPDNFEEAAKANN